MTPLELAREAQSLAEELGLVQVKLKRLAQLVARIQKAKVPGKRGRKAMPPAERLEVSERMRKYWAARRADNPEATCACPICSMKFHPHGLRNHLRTQHQGGSVQ